MNQIELCLSIAKAAHSGQTDKVGLPVILHPIRVGMMGSTEKEMCVGFLHDTIEDTEITYNELLQLGVDKDIAEAVQILSRPKDKPYFEYIQSILDSKNDLAIRVKFNDLRHNLSRAIKYGFKEQEIKCQKALGMIGCLPRIPLYA